MPQTIELVRVKTTLGDRVYPLDTRVYSNVGGKDLFFREYAGDLKGDEMILWHNESIDTTLQEVEPHLQQSPRYQRAEQTVYATNGQGQKIPQFRIQLIRALAAKGIVTAESQEDLEQKVMQESGRGFTPQQYTTMTQFLYQELQRIGKEDDAPTRSEAQIRQWLQGTTLGPRDSSIFYSLALATGSPAFEEWFIKASDTGAISSGFWHEYKFYITLRQTIMRYLARSKGELKGKATASNRADIETAATGNGHKTGTGFDMTPEIQIVLNQFMEEVNNEFSLARVVGVERVPVDVKERHQQKTTHLPHLAKGAYTGEAKEGISTVTLDTILSETTFFEEVASYVFQNYLSGCVTGKYPAPEAAAGVMADAQHIMGPQEHPIQQKAFASMVRLETNKKLGLIVRQTHHSSADPLKGANPEEFVNLNGLIIKPVDKSGQAFYPRIRESVAAPLSEWIMMGTLDTALGLEPQTIYRLLQHGTKLGNSVPTIYNEMIHAEKGLFNFALDRQSRRDLENRYRKLKERVARKYGLDSNAVPKFLLSPLLTASLIGGLLTHLQRTKPSNLSPEAAERLVPDLLFTLLDESKPVFNGVDDASYILGKADLVDLVRKGEGHKFLTKADCLTILECHGLPEQFMQFIPEANFVFDPKPDSQPLESAVAEATAEAATGAEIKIEGV